MVISQFYPIVAGAEKQALLLSKTLKARGHRIRVVTGWWLRGTPRHEVIEQIPVVRNFSVWGISGPRWARPLAAFVYMVTLFSYLLRYRKDYDIIHVHQALYPAFVAVLVSKLVNKPIVVKVGCSGEWGDVKAMTDLILVGDFVSARKWHEKLFMLAKSLLSMATNPIPIKAAMSMLNMASDEMRLPMIPLETSKRAALKKILTDYGLMS